MFIVPEHDQGDKDPHDDCFNPCNHSLYGSITMIDMVILSNINGIKESLPNESDVMNSMNQLKLESDCLYDFKSECISTMKLALDLLSDQFLFEM